MTRQQKKLGEQPRARRKKQRFRLTALRLVALLLLVGCQPAQEETAEGPAPQPPAPEPGALVQGWDCQTIPDCLGLREGRVKIFQRTVGKKGGEEVWTLSRNGEDGGVTTWTQSGGGPSTYEVHQSQVALEYRGELLEAYRFPIEPEDEFDVVGVSGQHVKMRVMDTNVSVETPAGTFSPCLIHRAEFVNHEEPEKGGLHVTTTICEGVGEVQQSIELPAMPNPVELTLLSADRS